jgi:endoplasmic reticulum Man9GlcNAc2 1,2-alpha-mannosidase
MYEDAMEGVAKYLIKRTPQGVLYTSELIPHRSPPNGEMFVFSLVIRLFNTYSTDFSAWTLIPKQDHLVCFLGGSLMLGAVTAGAAVDTVSIPPTAEELSDSGKRDWLNGVELIDTCMMTHQTKT